VGRAAAAAAVLHRRRRQCGRRRSGRRHLLAQGRQRIAFFGDINLPEVGQRYEGLCQALAQAGMAIDPALQVSASFLPDGGRLAVEELLRRRGFDAIFAGSDLLAMTAINTLRSQGLEVPRQIAVVGYDDIELSTYFHPPLTTIRQPIGGRAGAGGLAAGADRRPSGAVATVADPVDRARQLCLIYATDCINFLLRRNCR
jgi:hypothetical protein